jgi:hypothetical protein
MEPYTFNYLKSHKDRLPAIFEDFVHHDADFRFWQGELRSVQFTQTNNSDYPAQVDVEIWDEKQKAVFPLRYLLHTHHAIYPIRLGDGATNLHRLWQFRVPIITWLDTLKAADRERAQKRTATIKEDLMAAVWSPTRVAKRLEEPGGLEAC